MPSNQQPGYEIQILHNVLAVKLTGRWDLASDRDYLHDLSQAINNVNHQPWGMLVDMRDWGLQQVDSNLFSNNVANIHLDRKNQVCECWLVHHLTQGEQLVPFVATLPNLHFKRVLRPQDAQQWLSLFDLEMPSLAV